METRVELLEHTLAGTSSSALESNDEPLLSRVRTLQEEVKRIESQLSPLANLATVKEALARKSPLENSALLWAHKDHVENMSKVFIELGALAKTAGIDQEAIDISKISSREVRLAAALRERRQIHNEIKQLLQSYSLWVDAASSRFVR